MRQDFELDILLHSMIEAPTKKRDRNLKIKVSVSLTYLSLTFS